MKQLDPCEVAIRHNYQPSKTTELEANMRVASRNLVITLKTILYCQRQIAY